MLFLVNNSLMGQSSIESGLAKTQQEQAQKRLGPDGKEWILLPRWMAEECLVSKVLYDTTKAALNGCMNLITEKQKLIDNQKEQLRVQQLRVENIQKEIDTLRPTFDSLKLEIKKKSRCCRFYRFTTIVLLGATVALLID